MAEGQSLAGRVALVTGAASGMGRVMARALKVAGASVAGVDVDADGLSRLATEPVFAGKLLTAVADVSQTAAAKSAVQKAVETFGALDILINCAGISMAHAAGRKQPRIKFYEADPEGWQKILAINHGGAFLMARFAAEPMVKRGWDRMAGSGAGRYGRARSCDVGRCRFSRRVGAWHRAQAPRTRSARRRGSI